MTSPFWATVWVRFYALVVCSVVASRIVVNLTGETGAGRWFVRLGLVLLVARALGYF
jgi:hypothetical protein